MARVESPLALPGVLRAQLVEVLAAILAADLERYPALPIDLKPEASERERR